MKPPDRVSEKSTRFVEWALLAFLLAAAAGSLRIGVYLVASEFGRDPRYVLGCFEGFGIDVVFGCLAAAPLFLGTRRGLAPSLVLSFALLLLNAAGAHYHAMFEHLPTRSTLLYLHDFRLLGSSLREHAPVGLLMFEAAFPAIVCSLIARRLAPALSRGLMAKVRKPFLVAGIVALGAASLGRASSAQGQEYFGTIGPLLEVSRREATFMPTGAPGADGQNLEQVAVVERALATDNLGPPATPAYPFCTRPRAQTQVSNGHSVILLILESVDTRSFALDVGGAPVMPNLQRIAAQGVRFSRFFSTGNMSAYALPALFAGIPALPSRALLLRSPLPSVLGFPGILRRVGYETAYFHGSDLSFSNQREFLARVGFDRIVEPNPLSEEQHYGWGIPDGIVFDQVRSFVEEKRGRRAGPYFASVFTVSTHDPYVLPPNHRSRFEGDTTFTRFANSLSYLDDELGRFYDWYRRTEAPHGTILVLTGDHAPRVPFPGDPTDTTTGEFEYRFQVPLIVVGMDKDLELRARANVDRAAGHQDVPATLAAALGVAPPACHLGRSLVDGLVPEHRFVPSVAGESLDFFYVHDEDRRWMLELRTGRLAEYDWLRDPTFRHELSRSDPRSADAARFFESYLPLMNYAAGEDHLAPPDTKAHLASPLPRVTVPFLIAHRSIARGPESAPANSIPSLEQAIADHASWANLDVNTTSDLVPVVYHEVDVARVGPKEKVVPVEPVTLAELRKRAGNAGIPTLESVLASAAGRVGLCLNLETEMSSSYQMSLVREILRLLEALPKGSRIIISSSNASLLATVREFSGWEVAFRSRDGLVDPNELAMAEERGFQWVLVARDHATAALVRAAHERGIRVIVSEIESFADLSRLEPELPDGVMTENIGAFATDGSFRPGPP